MLGVVEGVSVVCACKFAAEKVCSFEVGCSWKYGLGQGVPAWLQ